MKKKLLLVSFLLIGIVAVSSFGAVQAKKIKNISVIKVHKMMFSNDRKPYHNHVIIDVQPLGGYLAGHIPGAYYVATAELTTRVADYLQCHPNVKIIVSCREGIGSRIAAEILSNAGFKNVYNLEGGINAWEDAGWEAEEGLGPPDPPPCPP